MTLSNFDVARLPQIRFGSGRFAELTSIIQQYAARRLLLVTGSRSFVESARWSPFIKELEDNAIAWHHTRIDGEPSPETVDRVVGEFHQRDVDLVVAIGGGSVLDAAKAIAGLLPFGNSVMDHLEGVGKGIPYVGPATPFIAVPTTAGTGSEATKNAVLSHQGENGYKKSFRHDTLVPQCALVDPQLLDTCSPAQIAANGMDAFTQLLESLVSTKANPFTDALALSGIDAVSNSLLIAWQGGRDEAAQQARANMAYGALLSGITLAQAGLGSVHGLASPLGAYFPIPHGVACGSLLAEATRMNIKAMKSRAPNHPALTKYADVGRRLTTPQLDLDDALNALLDKLETWTKALNIPKLREFSIHQQDIDKIVANSRGNSMQTNPIVLSDDEISRIVTACW